MHDPAVVVAASAYGIRRVPAVVIDGKLVDRCAGRGPDEPTLTRAIRSDTGRGFQPSHGRLRPRINIAHKGYGFINFIVDR